MTFKPKLVEKRWDVAREVELLKTWESEGRFKTKIDPDRKTIVIDVPPPYMSGIMHIGQVAGSYAQVDMIVRFLRMYGYNVVFPFYADRNGLPVEVQVERMYGRSMHEFDRDEFIRLCRQVLDEYERENVRILRRWGISFDYWPNGTDSEEYRALTQRTFIELWSRGLIYEAERPTLWCPRCKTAIAEAEVEYEEEKTYLNYIRFEVVDRERELIIATTRPELLPACVAVIYHPDDRRYADLRGARARVPLFNSVVPVLEHRSVNQEFGTGAVMVCTFGDTRDLAVVNELKLPIRVVIDKSGRLNELAGKYRGLTVKDARSEILKDLEREGLLVRREQIAHRVPVCWRCKSPVEIIVTREFFLRQLEFKDDLIKLVEERMEFYPPEYKSMLISWIRSLSLDWPISRRRYYATEIPIWYCVDEHGRREVLLPRPGRYYRPWRDEPPPEVKERCRTGRIVGEERVLDTWFDSSISWMYASGITKPEINVFDKVYPHSIVRPQGYEIIRTWLYYSVLRSYLLFRDVPFRYVRINGMGLDERGEAMHKSKGNIIEALPPVEKYGADAVRFWSAVAARLGSDYRYNEDVVKTGRDFVTKLWNIARFISQFPEVKEGERFKLTTLDEVILAKLEEVMRVCIEHYLKFDVYVPAHTLFEFAWHVFADHYVEAVKSRAYNRESLFSEDEQRGAWFTLHKVLKVITKLLAPIMPFVTDYIWRCMYGESVHDQKIEDKLGLELDRRAIKLLPLFMRFNSAIWTYKNKRKGISLAERLNAIVYVREDLEPLAREIKIMHKISDLRIGRPDDESKFELLDPEIGLYVRSLS